MEYGGNGMRVITFVTQKGGAGKTTLTVNCAVAAAQKKKKVLILDLDPQASAEGWYQDREAESPRLVRLESGEIAEAINKARDARYEYVLIDTPGKDEPATTTAIRAADFCIIPCRPTPVDLKATPPTVATINRLSKPAVFVLTQAPPRGERIREDEVGLGMLGIVCPVQSSLALPIRMHRARVWAFRIRARRQSRRRNHAAMELDHPQNGESGL